MLRLLEKFNTVGVRRLSEYEVVKLHNLIVKHYGHYKNEEGLETILDKVRAEMHRRNP